MTRRHGSRPTQHKNWGWLKAAHDFGRRDVWEEYRAILGHALDPDAYMALAAGYSGLASAAEAASRSDFSDPISDAEGESLAITYLTSALYQTIHVSSGIARKR